MVITFTVFTFRHFMYRRTSMRYLKYPISSITCACAHMTNQVTPDKITSENCKKLYRKMVNSKYTKYLINKVPSFYLLPPIRFEELLLYYIILSNVNCQQICQFQQHIGWRPDEVRSVKLQAYVKYILSWLKILIVIGA